MPHSRRYFESNRAYSICFRVRKGLPFVATEYMRKLLGGIMARTQRDQKVTLCHDLWMTNHVHLFVVARDPLMLANFYAEIQKKVTDALKGLLGKSSLRLWEGRAVVAAILDPETAINQIAYIYSNPSKANLVESIKHYPGFNSYEDFIHISSNLDSTVEHSECWVTAKHMPRLSMPSMRKQRDLAFTSKLKRLGRIQKLVREPNAWMKCFGMEDSAQIAETNQRILDRIGMNESEYAVKRQDEGKFVIGERALRTQSILSEHTPPKTERRIFVISSVKKLRNQFIQGFKELCTRCRECYFNALSGLYREWPPGVFRPSLAHIASALPETEPI